MTEQLVSISVNAEVVHLFSVEALLGSLYEAIMAADLSCLLVQSAPCWSPPQTVGSASQYSTVYLMDDF